MPLDIIVGTQWGGAKDASWTCSPRGLISSRAGTAATTPDNHVGLIPSAALIPSGIVYPHTIAVIGVAWLSIRLPAQRDGDGARSWHEVNPDRLRLSSAAHRHPSPAPRPAQETSRSGWAPGRGIGPYTDKAARTGIRLRNDDLRSACAFSLIKSANQILEACMPPNLSSARVADGRPLCRAPALYHRHQPCFGQRCRKANRYWLKGLRPIARYRHGHIPLCHLSTPTAQALSWAGIGFGHLGRVIGVTDLPDPRGHAPSPPEISGNPRRVCAHRINPGTNSAPPPAAHGVGWMVCVRYIARQRLTGWWSPDGCAFGCPSSISALHTAPTVRNILIALNFLRIWAAIPPCMNASRREEDIREVRAWRICG